MQLRAWTGLALLIASVTLTLGSHVEYLMGGHLINEPEKSSSAVRKDDLDAEESKAEVSSEDGASGYIHAFPFAINGGKPFSLEKDPVTGQINLEKAPPVKILNYTEFLSKKTEDSAGDKGEGEGAPQEDLQSKYYDERKQRLKDASELAPNEISPNFHDFLNLPVQYSSDKYGKDKYPLISSSYANTKVQSGSSSYNTYNHRPSYHRPEEPVFYYPTRKTKPSETSTSTTEAPTSTSTSTPTPTPTPASTSSVPVTASSTTQFSSTTRPTSTTASSTREPSVTTWKPKGTGSQYPDEYDDSLPIEKLQATFYEDGNRGPSRPGAAAPSRPPSVDEYYGEYDTHEDEHYEPEKPVKPAIVQAESSTTTASPRTSTTTSTSTATAVTPDGPADPQVNKKENSLLSSLLQFETVASTESTTFKVGPVTSMPLDNVGGLVQPGPAAGNRSPLLQTATVHQQSVFHKEQVNQQFPGQQSMLNDPQSVAVQQPLLIGQRPSSSGQSLPTGPQPMPMPMPMPMPANVFVESTSNIVVPPDQDTVSFVLGNRQNVVGSYYIPGTAIGDKNPYGAESLVGDRVSYGVQEHVIYGGKEHVNFGGEDHQVGYAPQPDNRGTVAVSSVSIVDPGADSGSKHWWSSASNNNEVDPYGGAPAVTPSAAPVTLTTSTTAPATSATVDSYGVKDVEGQVNEYVVFPMDDKYEQPVNASKPSRPHAGLPQLAENLTPPAEKPRPPHPYYAYQARPETFPRPLPGQHRPKPVSFPSQEVGGAGPNVERWGYGQDSKLPNILPQFRPNAKTSYGHRNPETIGTILAPQSSGRPRPAKPTKTGKPAPPPLAPGPQIPLGARPPYPVRPSGPPAGFSGIRRHSPPSPPPSRYQSGSRRPPTGGIMAPSYLQRLNPPPPGPIPAKLIANSPPRDIKPERGDRDTVELAMQSRLSPTKHKLRYEEEEEYSEEPPQTPPRPPLFPKPKGETVDHPRVATLQMIQQYGEEDGMKQAASNESDQELDVAALEDPYGEKDRKPEAYSLKTADRRKDENSASGEDPPVYVVYPVNSAVDVDRVDEPKTQDESSVVVGIRGPHMPLPPDTLLQGDYQNNEENNVTPGQYNAGRPVASDFPYPLEKPDPSVLNVERETPLLVPSDQRPDLRDEEETEESKDPGAKETPGENGVNVIPYLQDFVPFPLKRKEGLISTSLHRYPPNNSADLPEESNADDSEDPVDFGDSSTPIAYVFTPTIRGQALKSENLKDFDKSNHRLDVPPVLLPSQQPSSSSSSAPSPQSFMAPFVASASAEAPAKNGWSVVVVENPDRSDDQSDKSDKDSADFTQTERSEFDPDSFKPQLFGGFKPIYEFPAEDEKDSLEKDKNDSNDGAESSFQESARTV